MSGLLTGPRGGRYYISRTGTKVYGTPPREGGPRLSESARQEAVARSTPDRSAAHDILGGLFSDRPPTPPTPPVRTVRETAFIHEQIKKNERDALAEASRKEAVARIKGRAEKTAASFLREAEAHGSSVGGGGGDAEGRKRALLHLFGDRVPSFKELHALFSPPEKLRTLGPHKLTIQGVYFNDRGDMHVMGRIHAVGVPAQDWEHPSGEINRVFKRRGNKLSVEHESLFLPDHMQKQGIASDLLRKGLIEYKKLGVSRIDLHAAIDGAHVWARMGFFPSKSYEHVVRESLVSGLVDGHGVKQDAARKIVDKHMPRFWEIASLKVKGKPVGEDILRSTGGWFGEMNLDNKDAGYRRAKRLLGVK